MLVRLFGRNFRSLKDGFELSMVAADLKRRRTVTGALSKCPSTADEPPSVAAYRGHLRSECFGKIYGSCRGWSVDTGLQLSPAPDQNQTRKYTCMIHFCLMTNRGRRRSNLVVTSY